MIYLDNHATTPCDRRVADQMMPYLTQWFGNPHSTSHAMGRQASEVIDQSMDLIASQIRCDSDDLLMTSGATESNNLAIDGVMRHPRQKRRHIITSTIEHPAVLDVVERLEQDGFNVSRIGVHPAGHSDCGQVDLDQLQDALSDQTALVSIHWANNEIGVIQPIDAIAEIVHAAGALLHSDATQAVGRIPVELSRSDVDLVSASAHKFYGPKGVGFLVTASNAQRRRVRIKPLFVGGGQQRNLRSGTMAPAMVLGCAQALRFACDEQAQVSARLNALRNRLWVGLCKGIDGLQLNGPDLEGENRLAGNLNCMLSAIEGEAWMAACPDIAFSSGSACSSVDAKPSHVLLGLGLNESQARRSVRFGIGKFNTEAEMDDAIAMLVKGYKAIANHP